MEWDGDGCSFPAIHKPGRGATPTPGQDLAPPGTLGCQLFTEPEDYSTSAPINTLPWQKAKEKEEQKEVSHLQGIWDFCCVWREEGKKSLRKGWEGRAGGDRAAGTPLGHCCRVGPSETLGVPGRAWGGDGMGTGWVRGAPSPPGTEGLILSSPDQGICSKSLPALTPPRRAKVEERIWQRGERRKDAQPLVWLC